MRRILLPLCFTAILLSSRCRVSQADGAQKLSLEQIFSSSDLAAKGYGPVVWDSSGSSYTLLDPSKTVQDAQDVVRYDCASGARTIVLRAERLTPQGSSKPLSIRSYAISDNGKRILIFTNTVKVWRQDTRGDYWTCDLAASAPTRLGGPEAHQDLMFAKFSPDGKRVGYVRANNIYVEDAGGGHIHKITNDGSAHIINGTSDWVYEEELLVRDAWRWSLDGKSIAYWQFDTTGVKDYTLVNDTDSKYPAARTFGYPKAGETNSSARVGVVSVNGGRTRWIQIPGDPRNNYIARMEWAGNSTELSILQLNRLQNTANVYIANASTGEARKILIETDDAWLDYWNDIVPNGIQWIDNGKSFLWSSERSGWRHIYRVSRDGSSVRPITTGRLDVDRVHGVDEKNGWLYFTASPESAVERHLYRAKLDGSGGQQRVSTGTSRGTHSYEISPTGGWSVHTWSSFSSPPKYELVKLPSHEVARSLEDNAGLVAKLSAMSLPRYEFRRFRIDDGTELDAGLIYPPDFDQSKKYPLLIAVYGEPAGLTVLDGWAGAGYLWNCMLAQQGYIIASIENRGTPSLRGRAWRRSVYRKIGVIASHDQAEGLQAICKLPYIDASRVAVWGWSGGGSMTLNLMFRYPELYKVGMAVAPVPDIHLYDSIYQERYMGLPADNPEEYKQSSPITFAKNLQGDLLIVHGTGDDNVHFQGTETLINELVRLNKAFSLMVYPNRTHAISEGEGTTRHLFETLTRYLNQHLPAGPR